jgi:hypothetical protein
MTCSFCDQEQPAGAFCSGCGQPLAEPVQEAAWEITRNIQAQPEIASPYRKKMALVATSAGVVLLLALGGAAWASQRGDDNVPSDNSAPSRASDRPESPHDICTRQLIATATDIHDNSPGGYTNEIGVNGSDDPFLQAGLFVSTEFTRDYYAVGTNAAIDKLRQNAADYCSSRLNDMVRPNFPTDGTYPDGGQGSGGDYGVTDDSGSGCANGQTAISDGQGNLVCPNG